MSRKSDRKLLKKNIPDHFNIVDDTKTPLSDLHYDICITDLPSFKANREELLEIKNQAQPVYLPLLVLVENNKILKHNSEIWEQVDDIIEVPVPINLLKKRIQNQLRSRENSLQIAQKNEKLRLLEKAINSTDVGITITDATDEDDQIIFSNQGFTDLTGYSKDEIMGKNCRFLQNNDRNQEGRKEIRQLLENGEGGRAILRNFKKNGTMFWNELSIAPIKDQNGETTHFVGIQNDVTDLVETQQQLKVEKNHHKIITENTVDMISRHSLDGNYLFVTPSSEQLLGYKPEELYNMNAYHLFHPDDKEEIKKTHRAMFETKKPAQISYRIKTKDGDYKWVETISRLSLNPQSDYIVELQSTTRDITQRKQYEKELKQSLNEKNVLLQEIHHRVKNNLAVISGLLQIQQFDTDNEYVQNILGNSISRIKSMALIHEKLYRSNSLSHVDFREYIVELTESIKKSQVYDDKINVEIDCDNIMMNINQGVPCALILNEAISNSIEHAFTGREKGKIWVRFQNKGKQIHVTVKDDGIGMPDDIFEKEQPSMGITIIKTLIDQLDATKEFKNNDGTELSFTFEQQNINGAHSRFI
jgi:PAS domain S-box-containing protein